MGQQIPSAITRVTEWPLSVSACSKFHRPLPNHFHYNRHCSWPGPGEGKHWSWEKEGETGRGGQPQSSTDLEGDAQVCPAETLQCTELEQPRQSQKCTDMESILIWLCFTAPKLTLRAVSKGCFRVAKCSLGLHHHSSGCFWWSSKQTPRKQSGENRGTGCLPSLVTGGWGPGRWSMVIRQIKGRPGPTLLPFPPSWLGFHSTCFPPVEHSNEV